MQTAQDGLPPGGIARAYARLKQGRGWVIGFMSLLTAWMVARQLFPLLDPDLGKANFAMSVEASLSQAISYGGEMAILAAIFALLREVSGVLRDLHRMTSRVLELWEEHDGRGPGGAVDRGAAAAAAGVGVAAAQPTEG